MRDLIERLEKATGPDRELDALIQEQVVTLRMYESIDRRGGEYCIRYYPGPPGPEYLRLPRYTASIDAALTLVPTRHLASVDRNSDGTGCATCFEDRVGRDDPHSSWRAPTPAIALCIAALKARETALSDRKGIS